MSLATVAAVTLHSLPLSFEANRLAILDGIREAKSKGARLVVTPELCIPGYGCLDHFHEADTFADSWDQVAIILQDPVCKDIIVDLGLGVRHKNVRYNCRILITYKKVLLIKPKMSLANDGLYREMRHFSPWIKARTLETYHLEDVIADVTGQRTVDIGDAIISTLDTSVYSETCEELFVPSAPSIGAGLDGCEIFANASASHAELRKLQSRLDLIANSTRKQGGIYIYSNMVGIDGEARMMYDGSSMVVVNGIPVAQEEPFSLKRSSVITATIDLETVRSFRTTVSRNMQAAAQNEYPRVQVDIRLCRPVADVFLSGSPQISRPIEIKVLDPMEEIYKSTAVVLWQYLSTVGLGYLIPLSGGADSCSTSLMVFGMARLVLESIRDGDEKVLQDLRRVVGESDFQPQTPQNIVGKLFYTVYLGTRNSGSDTRRRAANLASAIGANHMDENIDEIVDAHVNFVKKSLKFSPQFAAYGGSAAEDLALQNIQARTRMEWTYRIFPLTDSAVTAYSLAQLTTTARQTSRKHSSLLVLGSANVDEILRGYYTKYDCSSADYNPLGSISKTDVRSFLHFCAKHWDLPCVQDFIDAVPSAELVPVEEGQIQVDETEMGLTYPELSRFGILRKVEKLGSFLRLLSESEWGGRLSAREVAEKTKTFFKFYAASRHKAVTLTPSVHLSAYNPDDNRHDLRPFLLVISWPWQFKKIDNFVEMLEANQGKVKAIKAA